MVEHIGLVFGGVDGLPENELLLSVIPAGRRPGSMIHNKLIDPGLQPPG
jgi:hypothetical protein